MTLQPAQTAAAQCNFVEAVKDYYQCKAYSLDCCAQKSAAESAYLLVKQTDRDAEGCEFPNSALCQIQKLSLTPVSCSVSPACSDLLTASVKQISSGGGYSKSITNNFDDSAYMSIELTPNSVAQSAAGSAHVIDVNGDIVQTTAFTTGTYFDGASVLSGSQYHPAVGIQYQTKPIVNSIAGSYLKKFRLYKYDNGVVSFVDIDISPTNLWACGTCSVVNPADLDLAATNVATAVKAQIENAVKSMDGALNIDLEVTKVTSSVGTHLYFVTKTKHLPTGKWWGINPQDVQISYYWAPTNNTLLLSSLDNALASPIYIRPGFTYTTFNFVSPCGTSTLNVNGIAVPQATAASTFYSINLSSPLTTTVVTNPPLTVSGTISTCNVKTLTATVTTSVPYTQQWLSPSATVLGTAGNLILTNPPSGTYQYKTFFSGSDCIITKSFTI